MKKIFCLALVCLSTQTTFAGISDGNLPGEVSPFGNEGARITPEQSIEDQMEQDRLQELSRATNWTEFLDAASAEDIAPFVIPTQEARRISDGAARGMRYQIVVDISSQSLVMKEGGKTILTSVVSTARPGKVTPTGCFVVDTFSPNHKSSLYNNAPMPWAIFFNGNIALHETNHTEQLGRPASAGCVRLPGAKAKQIYSLVYKNRSATSICVQK